MTYFPDLTPCDYFSFGPSDTLLAIGWLERRHKFHRGDVDVSLIARLTELLVNPWDAGMCMGWHDCGFCRFSRGPRQFIYDNTTITLGINNLFVPSHDCIFVAPSLILHYIDAHEYCPPPEFQAAVLACPEMRSMQYLKAIRKHATPEMLTEATNPIGPNETV